MSTWRENLVLVCDALLPPAVDDGAAAWRARVPRRALELLESQPALADDFRCLRQLLGALGSPVVCAALGGGARSLASMTREQRESFLRSLMHHPIGQLRGGALALKRLAGVVYYADADARGCNPLWPTLGYPGPIATAASASPAAEHIVIKGKPIQPLQLERARTLECDVVVVGSGAGGGIVAAELAAAGKDVIVLEKGRYLTEADFSQLELDSYSGAYLDGGLRATRDLSTLILAGSCLGGGTIVNYTTSFRTPDSVRAEWADLTGLEFFTGQMFTHSLDAVYQKLGINQQHNAPSTRDQLMRKGLSQQGWHVDAMPRDVSGCTQDDVCGYCGLGCVRGAKCSALAAALEPAAAQGVRIVVEADVQGVLVEGARAVGVSVRTTFGQIEVRAKKTVLAAGAIGTPAILLRSGIRAYGLVGRNLTLHPVTAVWGHFAEPVRPWTGTLQAFYSDQFADMDSGYGVRFETAPIHPSLMAMAMPWQSSTAYGSLVERLAHTSLVGVLPRDRYGGRVRINPRGEPVVDYSVSAYDQRHIRRGVIAAAEIMAAAGASEVFASQNRFVRWQPAIEPLESWVQRIDRVGFGSNRTLCVSFHQMGSCRMGTNPSTSVVGADGQLHSVHDLHVADASLFPTASGVNPMVTVSALAHYVAQHLI